MKLLFAIKALHDISGGAERVLADVTGALAERGHDVIVLTYDIEGQAPFYPLNSKVRMINLALGHPKRKARLLETLKRMAALRQAVKRENPDVVVGFMHSMFVPAAFALIGTPYPLVASEHIVPEHYQGKPLESFLLLAASMFTKRYTVLSENIRRSYPAFLQTKMVPVSNPVTVPEQISAKTHQKDRLLLSVGRLDPQKDFSTLIEAFAIIAEKHPDWRLRIVGEGPLRGSLEKKISDLKLSERITLPGRSRDIISHYKDADLFVLSSRYESFGLAAAEAMAHGIPTIAFQDCAGLNEIIIDGQNGLLAESQPHRAQGLAQILDRVMSDEILKNKLSSQAPASVSRFKLSSVAEQWDHLLRTV